jgi:hypothetical protein
MGYKQVEHKYATNKKDTIKFSNWICSKRNIVFI